MNIDNLTFGELKKIAAMFSGLKEEQTEYEVGKCYFIRTVTHHYTGRVVRVTSTFVELEDAAWIADDGRFHDFLKTGVANEVEPYVSNVCVRLGGVLDSTEWPHKLPREQK